MVQASSRAYVYQSTNDPYHARTTTSRHYHSFYYFRGYSRDASRYNNRASGYQIMTEQRRNIIIPIPIGVIPTQCVREAQVHELLPEAELVLENKEKRRRARI